MKQPANLIILSDNGMAEKSSERVIALDQVASPADYRIAESGPYASLAAQPGREAALESALLTPHPHMQYWLQGAIPTDRKSVVYGNSVSVCLDLGGRRTVSNKHLLPATFHLTNTIQTFP